MLTFELERYNETEIVLKEQKHLAELYEVISARDNFIIAYVEDGIKRSKVIISDIIASGVDNGEITLKSEEE